MIVLGIGARRGIDMRAVLDAVHQAISQLEDDVAPDRIATAAFKRDERGLLDAAQHLGLPIGFVESLALADSATRAPYASARVEELVGVASVAEAAALAEAGPGSRLLVARLVCGNVTCAIAQGCSQ